MAFNSLEFLLYFLPVVIILYWVLARFMKPVILQVFLLVASFVFYCLGGINNAVVLVINVVVNWLFVRWILSTDSLKSKKCALVLGIVFNVAVLCIFKYLFFIVSNIMLLFKGENVVFNLILPLGISFITFQQIAYLVDSFRGETKDNNFLHYCLYVLYFPKILSGPITLNQEFMLQLKDEKNYILNWENCAKGFYVLALGLFKKIIIADLLSKLVSNGFLYIYTLSSLDAIVIMLAFTFQIYFDFSGYCDIARGVSLFFNIELPNNFDEPYKATSVVDFWKRWNITLTDFLRKYIYFPLGGNRKGKFRTYTNILLVFLISGLWHGANWTFAAWGVMHGIASILVRVFDKYWNKLYVFVRWLLTFTFINFTWIVFKVNSLAEAKNFFIKLFCGGLKFTLDVKCYLAVLLCFAIIYLFKAVKNMNFKLNFYKIVFATCLICCSLLNISQNFVFIYGEF